MAASGGRLIMPSLDSDVIGIMAIFRDTSGSIYASPQTNEEFMGHICSIHNECRPVETHIFDIDSSVVAHHVFTRDEQIDAPLPPKGGGGTRFEPAFEEIERLQIEPVCAVYLTDMWGTFPRIPPPYPTMWVDYGDDTKPPFGEHIFIGNK